MQKTFHVYIMTNQSGTLYVGVTSNLDQRVHQHKQKTLPGFTSRYNISKLVYFEDMQDAEVAIAREKQIKGWLRAKKLTLIEAANPGWADLSSEWFAVPEGIEILRCAQDDNRKTVV